MPRTSVSVAGGLYRLDTLPTSDLSPSDLAALRQLHAACFPADVVPPDAPPTAWLDRVAVCHDPDACVWLLLWETEAARERTTLWPRRKPAAETTPLSPAPTDTLVGMCAGTLYTSAMYGFALGVHPRCRGFGLGPRVMHGLQAAALAAGVGAIAATVDSGAPMLVAYYVGHGGVVQETGGKEGEGWVGCVGGRGSGCISSSLSLSLNPASTHTPGVTAPGAPPPPSVRVVKTFDAAELARVTAAADAAIAAALDAVACARR